MITGIDYAKITPMLIKEVVDLRNEVDVLKQRLDNFEKTFLVPEKQSGVSEHSIVSEPQKDEVSSEVEASTLSNEDAVH